ncbi:MAG: hypothetical protein AAF125_09665, partial [Chloroflexota bacterium]
TKIQANSVYGTTPLKTKTWKRSLTITINHALYKAVIRLLQKKKAHPMNYKVEMLIATDSNTWRLITVTVKAEIDNTTMSIYEIDATLREAAEQKITWIPGDVLSAVYYYKPIETDP